jgi:hypothetical protein
VIEAFLGSGMLLDPLPSQVSDRPIQTYTDALNNAEDDPPKRKPHIAICASHLDGSERSSL